MTTIQLEGGKYSVTNDNGILSFRRNGELWPTADDLAHSGLVLALVQEIERLREEADEAHASYAAWADTHRGPALVDGVTLAAGIEMAINKMDLRIDAAADDARRLGWLTEDHADPAVRARCRELLGRIGVMGHGDACAQIDHEMGLAA